MIDAWYKFLEKLKQFICHHEYVYKRGSFLFSVPSHYVCRKCGKVSLDVPEKLIVKDDDNV